MISNEEIIINRCSREGCGIVAAFVLRRQRPMIVREFAGNTPCESLGAHNFSEWTRETIRRDVLILQALWTTGRAIHPALPSDPTAHILADRLGWRIGDFAALHSLPAWLREPGGLQWPALHLAARVAEAMREEWSMDTREYETWSRIAVYLKTWEHKTL